MCPLQCRFMQCRADASQPVHFPNFIWKDQETPCWSRRLGARSRKKRRSIDGIYGIAPNVGCPKKKKAFKDKVYPSRNKTNCPNKTKPAVVTALTGRRGSGVGAVTQPLFQCTFARAAFAFLFCRAELAKPWTRKLWYSRQIFLRAMSAQSPLWLCTDLNLQSLISQVFVY